jgi:Uncharacterised nucleotidyltransferase
VDQVPMISEGNLPADLALAVSGLLLAPGNGTASPSETSPAAEWRRGLLKILASRPKAQAELLALANSHHVIVRALTLLSRTSTEAGNDQFVEFANQALQKEMARIGNALRFLSSIRSVLENEGCDLIVIKSLDHWPDLGSDLDLFTTAAPAKVIDIMRRRLNAEIAPRSWGDRLAGKWNFTLHGLPESVEIHIGRLGQTGEQVAIANSLAARSTVVPVAGSSFRVPTAVDRLLITTLQRMYRHFCLRLCDVVDSVQLLQIQAADYGALRHSAEIGGIWNGVATYLTLVSEYAESFGNYSVGLPPWVRSSAQFGADQLVFKNGFLRVPILPHSAKLYFRELINSLRRAELRRSLRIGLLPYLATAAAVGQKITGSDKGIW